MILIYSALPLGGIETFFVRLAKIRHENNKATQIIMTARRNISDPQLLGEMMRYAKVTFIEDFLLFPWLKFLPTPFLLILPIFKKQLAAEIISAKQVHVPSSIYGFFYFRLLKAVGKNIPLTIGVYHSKEFTWESKGSLPYFEKINRRLFASVAKARGAIWFNDSLKKFYEEKDGLIIDERNIFPIGVINDNDNDEKIKEIKPHRKIIRIVSIGRLTPFKGYNLWMIPVIAELSKKYEIEYDIYGEGVLRDLITKKISDLNLENRVFLKGNLPYEKFRDAVKNYDLFVGSGTSIIEAAYLGVPSIVGIESVFEPMTYGFVGDIPGFSYHEDGLYPKKSVLTVIEDYFSLPKSRKDEIQLRCIKWANQFSMQSCLQNFDEIAERRMIFANNESLSPIQVLLYTISFILFSIKKRVFKIDIYS